MKYLYQRLVEEGCSTVVMESTGSYWMGAYDHLELRGINTVLIWPQVFDGGGGEEDPLPDQPRLGGLSPCA